MMEEDDGGLTKSQRARLTCSACFRRKIKCDKNIPCSACTKRGLADSCTRGEIGRAKETSARPTLGPTMLDASVAVANDTVQVQALLQRIARLEDQLEKEPHNRQLDPTQVDPQQADELVDGHQSIDADAGDCDAPTVLEFMAWGRRKDNDFANSQEHESGPKISGMSPSETLHVMDVLSESTKRAQLDVLEALVPSSEQIKYLVDYHNTSLLWYHGSYSSKIFSDDLVAFVRDQGGSVYQEQLNLQWLALLFSILTGSMTCASKSTIQNWGFSDTEKETLCHQWYRATVTCLNMANYVENHSIYAVQAIATLTIAAHSLGYSNSQSALLASAGRIAQSLGLHRLGPEPSSTNSEQLRRREAGRRVFNQLCTQDWFSIPFSESYALNPKFSTTVKPLNCNDDDMAVHPLSMPTQASYCNYRYDIAALMPQLLDAMASCNTPLTKYEQVLKYDDKMRKLATACMPTFFSTNAPVDAEWPVYVGWARRSLTICAAHKIIMIHRKFVALSFTNTAFAFTRRTCIAASKTILKEAFAASDENGPVLWIDQAFAVAAGIILSLDTFHRKPADKEHGEHMQLVADTIAYLKIFEHSKIALRGVHLLSSLQRELDGSGPVNSRKRRHSTDDTPSRPARRSPQAFQIQTFIREISQNLESPTSAASPGPEPTFTVVDNAWDVFLDLLPPQTGFDGQYLFDDFGSIQF